MPDAEPLIDLRGRTVVVTGANSGIGLGIARGVVRAGGSVVIWARREDRNNDAVQTLRALGGQAEALSCDVSREEDVKGCIDRTIERFGRLDALVANAGVSGRTDFVDMELSEWRRVLDVNLDGAFLCLRAGARQLVKQGEGGALVGISSTSAVHGAPGQEHYSAGKSAMLGIMRSLAVELAKHRIRCNALLPGWTETGLTAPVLGWEKFMTNTTNRTPVRRWATIHDFETVGAFLCDPTITFHTGDSMVVDGGYTVY
jgi:NAD(P)-dependent dehydrogenase (short-subunit alcohol dehydrogenase family)